MPQPLTFKRRGAALPLIFFVLPLGCFLSFMAWSWFLLTPLQKQYFPAYTAMAVQGSRPLPVWWIWKTAPKHKPELAGDEDVVSASAADRGMLPLALSPEAQAKGWTGLVRAQQVGNFRGEKAFLRDGIYGGESVSRLMVTPLCGMALFALLYLVLRGNSGTQSQQEERHGRRTKGPELTSPLEWRRRAKADGIRFRLAGKFGLPGASLCIPRELEASHILLMGDTGSGKSNAIRQVLRQVEKRGESAIVYDPAGEFVQEFYRPERGDYILNPLDDRCPFWNLDGELSGRGVEDAIAAADVTRNNPEAA